VAEHTFALILALSRKVHEAFVRVRQGNFSLDGLRGFDLKDKTIGVVGAGHIGLHVIRIARGFGMNVLAFDVRRDRFLAEVLGFAYADLDSLLGRSDIITLHAPDNQHTHHLIHPGNVGKIKRGAVLINTARGGLVNTEALLQALGDGILAGAGLDVLEGEESVLEESALLADKANPELLRRAIQNHLILKKPNVVFTPPNAFNSQEALERILQTTAENIMAFVAGLVSIFSSSSGVVLPTFIPTVLNLIDKIGGGNPVAVISSINVGSHVVDVSPLSTLGALCIAAAASYENKRKLFRHLLIYGFLMTFFGAAVCYLFFGLWTS
jgi:lactate dehydrogenase-like 2-hydroxyacid dehydrogenase